VEARIQEGPSKSDHAPQKARTRDDVNADTRPMRSRDDPGEAVASGKFGLLVYLTPLDTHSAVESGAGTWRAMSDLRQSRWWCHTHS